LSRYINKDYLTLKTANKFLHPRSFNADGTKFVSLGPQGTVLISSTGTGENLFTLKGHSGIGRAAFFSDDGKLVFTLDTGGTARIWNAETGKELFSSEAPAALLHTQEQVYGALAAFNSDGSRVFATIAPDKDRRRARAVRVWDARTGAVVFTGTLRAGDGRTQDLTDVAWSPDGTQLLSLWDESTTDGRYVATWLHIWGAEKGEVLQSVPLGRNSVGRLNRLHKGVHRNLSGVTVIDSSSPNMPLAQPSVMENADGKTLYSLAGAGAWFTPNRSHLLEVRYGAVLLYDVKSGAKLHTLKGHAEEARDAIMSLDGSRIITTGDDRVVRVWATRNGVEILTLLDATSAGARVVFSPDAKRIAVLRDDGMVRIYHGTPPANASVEAPTPKSKP
jgi:WD40 repeat protein